jgi:hypothetical protein
MTAQKDIQGNQEDRKAQSHRSEAQGKRAGIVWGTFFAGGFDFFDVRSLEGLVGIY